MMKEKLAAYYGIYEDEFTEREELLERKLLKDTKENRKDIIEQYVGEEIENEEAFLEGEENTLYITIYDGDINEPIRIYVEILTFEEAKDQLDTEYAKKLEKLKDDFRM